MDVLGLVNPGGQSSLNHLTKLFNCSELVIQICFRYFLLELQHLLELRIWPPYEYGRKVLEVHHHFGTRSFLSPTLRNPEIFLFCSRLG